MKNKPAGSVKNRENKLRGGRYVLGVIGEGMGKTEGTMAMTICTCDLLALKYEGLSSFTPALAGHDQKGDKFRAKRVQAVLKISR